jgi:hypothetical protein
MTLANVKSVVYLQSDPGQYRIGALMYNLSNPLEVSHPYTHPPAPGHSATKYWAPEPVGADLFNFAEKGELEAAFTAFAAQAAANPFYTPTVGRPDASSSITSFLCTDAAKTIFDTAAARLDAMALDHPTIPHRPVDRSCLP